MTVERESLEWHLARAQAFIEMYLRWDESLRHSLGKTALETAIIDVVSAIAKIPTS